MPIVHKLIADLEGEYRKTLRRANDTINCLRTAQRGR